MQPGLHQATDLLNDNSLTRRNTNRQNQRANAGGTTSDSEVAGSSPATVRKRRVAQLAEHRNTFHQNLVTRFLKQLQRTLTPDKRLTNVRLSS